MGSRMVPRPDDDDDVWQEFRDLCLRSVQYEELPTSWYERFQKLGADVEANRERVVKAVTRFEVAYEEIMANAETAERILEIESLVRYVIDGWRQRTQADYQSLKDASDLASEKLKSEELQKLPYREYLKTKHWNFVRKDALRRAGNRCQLCNAANRELHVHHRTYERVGCERPDDLLVLCKVCHDTFHDRIKLTRTEDEEVN